MLQQRVHAQGQSCRQQQTFTPLSAPGRPSSAAGLILQRSRLQSRCSGSSRAGEGLFPHPWLAWVLQQHLNGCAVPASQCGSG